MNMRVDHKQSLQFALSKQMLQSVELLQFTAQDLQAYVAAELERNPFLDLAEPEPEAAAGAPSAPPRDAGRGLIAAGSGGGGAEGALADLADLLGATPSLHEVLERDLGLAVRDPATRLIGTHVIRAITPDGYLGDPVDLLAMQLGTDPARVEEVLLLVQRLAPAGIGARTLAECLALQLRERDRLDPAMEALLDNLPLMARGNHAALRRLCGVDDEDLAGMFAEIRRLDPKPGRAFDLAPVQMDLPDVFLRRAPDGGWSLQVNDAALPRVLVNMTYYRALKHDLRDAESRSYMTERLRSANWLARGLDQRIRTILNVATEIVRQQAAFFEHGVEHLRPLKLRDIAEALGVHESTVSRVTSNKSIATERGIFPMKYFLPAGLGATEGSAVHAADSVRHRIRQIIEAEGTGRPLSDGTIAGMLAGQNIRIARRTVTKYREAMRIPSVAERARRNPALGSLALG